MAFMTESSQLCAQALDFVALAEMQQRTRRATVRRLAFLALELWESSEGFCSGGWGQEGEGGK